MHWFDRSREEQLNALQQLLQNPAWQAFQSMCEGTAQTADAHVRPDQHATLQWHLATAQTCRQLAAWPENQLRMLKRFAEAAKERETQHGEK